MKLINSMLSAFILITMPLSAYAQIIESKYFYFDVSDWNLIDSNDIFNTPEEFLAIADTYFDQTRSILVNATFQLYPNKVKIVIVSGSYGSSKESGGVLYIGADFITSGYDILSHELIHALWYFPSIQSYSEGIANYIMNMIVPENRKLWFFNGNIHEIVNAIWLHEFNRIDIINLISGFNTSRWSVFESFSLVAYLSERYGIEKFIKYFEGGGYLSLMDVYSSSVDEIFRDWTKYISAFSPDSRWMENWEFINSYFPE